MSIWDQNPRRLKIRVTVGGADVSEFVVGDVTVDRSGVLPTCDFTLFTPRLAFYGIGSISDGPHSVQVRVLCRGGLIGPDEEILEFDGLMEGPSNTGLYVPQGQIHAISKLSRIANTPGCLLTAAFPEKTRFELLSDFLASALVPVTLNDGGIDSGTVTKPQDLQAITPLDLLSKWGNVDGWEVREEDSTLRLVRIDEIAAAGLTPKWEFTRSNFFHCSEAPPGRPITKWIVQGSFTYLEPDGTVVTDTVDGTGTTRVTITTVNGAITEKITERIEDYTPLGTTIQTPLTATVVKRETVTNTYGTSGGFPIAQLVGRTTVREAFFAPLSSAGTGGSDYTFTDGTFHHGAMVETLQEVERITETFTWHVLGCYLSASTHEYQAWLARPVETSDDGTHTDAGTVWPDGTTRIDAFQVYGVTDNIETAETFLPLGGIVQPPYSSGVANSNFSHPYGVRYRYLKRTRSNPSWSTPRDTIVQEQTWKEGADGTRHTLRTVTWGTRAYYDVGSAGFYFWAEPGGKGSSDTTTTVPGPIPIPDTYSPTERQYSLVPVTAVFESIGSFEPKTATRSDETFETPEEFDRWARWQMRKDFADTLVISHPYQPSTIFREWDPVRASDPARRILDAPSWLSPNTKYTFDPANGTATQATTVKIDPLLAVVGGCQ